MKDKWINDIFNEKVIMELSNPSMHAITGNPLYERSEKEIQTEIKSMNKSFTKTGIDRELTTRLKHLIIAVDGETGRATINNFVDNELFATDSRALRQHIKSMSPDLDLTYTFVSDATGDVKEMDIPIGIAFFWPGT